MVILIHSSKTMRSRGDSKHAITVPILQGKANKLHAYISTLGRAEIMKSMKVSATLADEIIDKYTKWALPKTVLTRAAECFLGDIYSGLQAQNWDTDDWVFANQNLRILSGLYGILRPIDGIKPYRLEMGYRLRSKKFQNLYEYWGKDIADTLQDNEILLNLAADEYSKTITPYWDKTRIFSPKFLTISPKTGEPSFVVVHAKIARGAFASWMIKNRVDDPQMLSKFNELGYSFSPALSTKQEPVFICQEFGGLGLSVRLK